MASLGFLNLLTLVFVVAKLFGHFPYSWFVVFLPVIATVTLTVLALVALAVLQALSEKKFRTRF